MCGNIWPRESILFFFFSSRRRHTRSKRDWSSDVCSSDLLPNMREGKIARLDAWLAGRDLRLGDFRQSWFYSDSRNDIPLLSRVTHPVAVNADPTLAALASEKGWPTLRIR